MNLIFRMIYLLIASFFKPRLPIEKPKNQLTLRVLPNDIDLNKHMNNGRYLTICDLSRVDMFIRTGLAKSMYLNKWNPIISEHTMTYKRPLDLFQEYQVSMEITGWDEKSFFMVHTFTKEGRVVAEGTSKGVIISKLGVITPKEVMKRVEKRLAEKYAS